MVISRIVFTTNSDEPYPKPFSFIIYPGLVTYLQVFVPSVFPCQQGEGELTVDEIRFGCTDQ